MGRGCDWLSAQSVSACFNISHDPLRTKTRGQDLFPSWRARSLPTIKQFTYFNPAPRIWVDLVLGVPTRGEAAPP